MKVTALLLVATASISSAVRLEIQPFKRLIPADVLRGKIIDEAHLVLLILNFNDGQ